MTRFAKILAPTGLMMAAAVAMPAHAQVDGKVATVDIPRVVISTPAFQTAYQQVDTTYAQQLDLRRVKATERQALLAKYDKNADKQVDDAELAAMKKSPDLPKMEALENDIKGLTGQIDGGRIFATEQVLLQFGAALEEVVKAQQIKIVLDPASLLYAPAEADISQAVITSLSAKVPAVGVVPPADWQPSNEAVTIYQQIQQRLITAQYLQQQQAAQQAAQQQPAPTAPPAGR